MGGGLPEHATDDVDVHPGEDANGTPPIVGHGTVHTGTASQQS